MRTTTLKHKHVTVWDDRRLRELDPSNIVPLDTTPLTADESAAMDREFEVDAREYQHERSAELKARAYTVSLGPIEWVSSVDDWVSCLLGWEYPGVSADSDEPLEARKIALTLHLPGGSAKDAVKVTVETKVRKQINRSSEASWHEALESITLTVYEDGNFYPGFVEIADRTEMGFTLVALKRNPPAEVSDRVMRVLLGIEGYTDDWPAPLYAALKRLNKCQACGRKLDDPVSRVLQLGPICASHLGLEHSQRMAEAVMQRRQRGEV